MSTLKFKICHIIKKYLGISIWRYYFKSYLKEIKIITQREYDNVKKEEKSRQVWTMWLQEDIPEICQICLHKIKEYYPNTIVITEKNIREFVNIPEVIWQKYKQGKIIPAHFSDYVRTCLLDEYGGLWIDATCLLTQKVPEYIWESSFYILKNFEGNRFSNYFIYSDSNNYLIKMIKIFLEQYWKKEDKEPGYFFYHDFVRTATKNNTTAKEIWEKIPIGLNANTKIFAKILFEDYDENTFNWLNSTSFLHKLTYKKIAENDTNPNSYYRYIMKTYGKEIIPQNNSLSPQ